MRRLFFAIATALLAVQGFAQDIEVVEFSYLATDMTANTAGTIVLDQNGEKCALIKVSTSKTDFSFDAGMIGIVKTIPKEGEIWVYVPEGVKRLSISHAGMETLHDYDLGTSVKKACTYRLTLKTSKDVVMQTVKFKVSPANATILLESADNNPDFGKQPVALSNGEAVIKIPVGNYRYTAILTGYNIESGTFELANSGSKNVLIEMVAVAGTPSSVVQVQTQTQPKLSQDSALTPSVQTQPQQSPAPVLTPGEDETITVKGISFKMIAVQGGTFSMGSENGDSDEKPVHEVTLSSYHIGETEVTQALWEAVMGSNPSKFKNPQNPVETVSWTDCQEFISKLNSLIGKQFRLPTEAEWEYAARGGNKSSGYKYSGSDDIGTVAWYGDNSKNPKKRMSHIVKTKSPNELGIFDMSGNVWEWCNDWYGDYPSSAVTDPKGPSSASLRVNRGGSWNSIASSCRVPFRGWNDSTYRFGLLGLRLAF